jgi:predicted kinase
MKKQKIILTRGLPASGKTSWSKEQVAKSNGKVKRVNKDDLREMVDNGIWSKTNEQMILNARDALVTLFISNKDVEAVIVDDTNFEEKHFNTMVGFADAFNRLHNNNRDITVEYKDFLDVSLDECLHRDSLRTKPVGEKVIKGMHQRYILPTIQDVFTNVKNGNTIICDIDGCAAHRCDRNWFEYDKVINDEPDFAVRNIVNAFYDKGYNILFVSGREGTAICRELTQRWLNENGFKHHALYMRKEGDYRRDSIVKKEIYDEQIKDKYVVEFVLDDRSSVVATWREIGLKCLQVQPGDF